MTNVLDKFSRIKQFVKSRNYVLQLFYVFDDYMGKNYMFITKDDQCYAFGTNYYACLGLGHRQEVEYPTHVKEISGVKINEFFRGSDFMFGRTIEHEYYGWGINDSGQLGLGYKSYTDNYFRPTRIEYMSGKDIVTMICGRRHVMALTAQGDVYAWGANNMGQCGTGPNNKTIIDAPIKLDIDFINPVKSIACGDNHSIAMTVDQHIYVWGDNNCGQLGTGDYDNCNKPKHVKLSDDIYVHKIVCCKNSTYYLVNDGNIYYCGQKYLNGNVNNINKLTVIETDEKFIDIFSLNPYNWCFAKTPNGCVYQIMKNEFTFFETNFINFDQYFAQKFQITNRTISLTNTTNNNNNNNNEQNRCGPFDITQLDYLSLFPQHLKQNIKDFYIFEDNNSGKNCLYIDNNDIAYGLGANYNGILGVGDTGAIGEPKIIKELSRHNINKFYRGQGFMLAKNDQHEIFVWGKNHLGQLGLGHETDQLSPVKNTFFSQLNIVQISCGADHTLALTDNGEVYAWGSNEWGQIGLGDQFSQRIVSIPHRIAIYIRIKSVSCGDYHSMILTIRTSVYSWGKNDFGQLGHYGCEYEKGYNSILMSNVKTIICNGRNSFVLTNFGEINVYGQIVCNFNLSTSHTTIQLPSNAQYTEIEPTNDNMIVARFDEGVHEIKPMEVPLEMVGPNSYRNYLADNYGITYKAIHMKNYERLMLLGTGTYGPTFKCQDRETNKLFVLKKFKCPGLNQQKLANLDEELNKMSMVKHDNLAPIVKYSIEKDKFLYIRQHFYDNTLLDITIMKALVFGRRFGQTMCPLEYFITFELFREIVVAMDYLHSHKPPVIHRNLKTTNIFTDNNSSDNKFIKVSEFGFEKLDTFGIKINNSDDFKSQYRYTALEVLKGRKYGINADIYSMAIIGDELFEVTYINDSNIMDTNSSISESYKSMIQLLRSMQTSPKWWKRPNCKDIINTLDMIAIDHNVIINDSDFYKYVSATKSFKNQLFYKLLKSRLCID
ncbi:uncharacterized protein LOC128964028 [Oppia nitens]|uniref:uncharacterized protein LOC128964028 n=1 Tax=Oppia nitens TaxID=1686743 RepID=UPI0023D980A3|nr:uncharacterized protein LOC128964028 [Oppia nitens]